MAIGWGLSGRGLPDGFGTYGDLAVNKANSCLLAMTVLALPATAVHAQDPGGVVIEMSDDAGGGEWTSRDARPQAMEYVQGEKGWAIGGNDGGRFYVVVESETIPCGPENKNFVTCRNLAFMGAMLKAKKAMAEFLDAEVASQLSRIQSMQQAEATTPEGLGLEDSAVEGMSDEMLAMMGQDPKGSGLESKPDAGSTPASEPRKSGEKPVISTQLASAVQIKARCEVSSLQAYRVFESIGADGKGQIAVVCVYSNKSHELRDALVGKGEAPTGAPGPRISDWAKEQGPEGLLYAMGPQYRYDENGNLVLMAFGQAMPISSSGQAEDVARDQARAAAQQALRQYLGEMVATETSNRESASVDEYASGAQRVMNDVAFRSQITAAADALKMPGMSAAYSWEADHPQTDRPIYGVVMTMSVADAIKANGLRERFMSDGGSRGGRGIADRKPPRAGSGSGTGRTGSGGRKPGTGSGGSGPAGGEP